jgi:hypothetical protein
LQGRRRIVFSEHTARVETSNKTIGAKRSRVLKGNLR